GRAWYGFRCAQQAGAGFWQRQQGSASRGHGWPVGRISGQAARQEVSSLDMLKSISWRSTVVAAVCLFGVLSLLPNFLSQSVRDRLPGILPSRAITLGLDLQGGSYLLLEVDVAPVFKERLESMVGDVRAALRAARINYRGLGVQGDAVS